MKKLLFVLAMLACSPAQAASLPDEFVANWCFDYNWANRSIGYTLASDGKCPGEYIKINRNGYESGSVKCRFTAIEIIDNEITKKVENNTFVYTVARCRKNGKTWTERQELVGGKIDLLVKPYGKVR